MTLIELKINLVHFRNVIIDRRIWDYKSLSYANTSQNQFPIIEKNKTCNKKKLAAERV